MVPSYCETCQIGISSPTRRNKKKLNFLVHVLQVYERIKLKVSRSTNMHQKLEKRQQILIIHDITVSFPYFKYYRATTKD